MMVAWRLEFHRRFVTWMGTKLKQWLCCRLLLHFRSALQQPHENEWQLSSHSNDSNKRENMIPDFWSMELTVTGKIDILLYNRYLTSLSVLNAGRKTVLFFRFLWLTPTLHIYCRWFVITKTFCVVRLHYDCINVVSCFHFDPSIHKRRRTDETVQIQVKVSSSVYVCNRGRCRLDSCHGAVKFSYLEYY